jgi:hypothetical protein
MFLCNISLQLVLLVIKKGGRGIFGHSILVFLCLTAATTATDAAEAEAWEAEAEVVEAMEAEAEVVEAEAPMEAAEGESLCFGCC